MEPTFSVVNHALAIRRTTDLVCRRSEQVEEIAERQLIPVGIRKELEGIARSTMNQEGPGIETFVNGGAADLTEGDDEDTDQRPLSGGRQFEDGLSPPGQQTPMGQTLLDECPLGAERTIEKGRTDTGQRDGAGLGFNGQDDIANRAIAATAALAEHELSACEGVLHGRIPREVAGPEGPRKNPAHTMKCGQGYPCHLMECLAEAKGVDMYILSDREIRRFPLERR
jgi:hypothetical protein